MSDHTAAIQESNDRKAALDRALKAKAAAKKPIEDHGEKIGVELNHMEDALHAHGLSIADLLRTVAKHFHGVDVPVYQAPAEEAEG